MSVTKIAVPTANIAIFWPNFDYNIADKAWLKRQYERIHGPKASALTDQLRWWGAERSASDALGVSHEFRVDTQGDAKKPPYELESIHVGERNNTYARHISVSLESSTYLDTFGSIGYDVSRTDALAAYDSALAAAKAELPSASLAAYVALRSRVADALELASKVSVVGNTLVVYFSEGLRSYLAQFVLRQLPNLTTFITVTDAAEA